MSNGSTSRQRNQATKRHFWLFNFDPATRALRFNEALVWSCATYFLNYSRGASQGELVEWTGLHHGTVKTAIANLTSLGLLTRKGGVYWAREPKTDVGLCLSSVNGTRPEWWRRYYSNEFWKVTASCPLTVKQRAIYYCLRKQKRPQTISGLAMMFDMDDDNVTRICGELRKLGLIEYAGRWNGSYELGAEPDWFEAATEKKPRQPDPPYIILAKKYGYPPDVIRDITTIVAGEKYVTWRTVLKIMTAAERDHDPMKWSCPHSGNLALKNLAAVIEAKKIKARASEPDPNYNLEESRAMWIQDVLDRLRSHFPDQPEEDLQFAMALGADHIWRALGASYTSLTWERLLLYAERSKA